MQARVSRYPERMRDYTPILQSILSAAASALNAEERPTGRVELTPGSLPAWDDCCEGQLYLRVPDVYPTAGKNSPFPQKDSSQAGVNLACAVHGLAVHIGLGVLRCAETVDDNGNAPTPAEVTADAEQMLADMATLLDVLVCIAPRLDGILSLKIDQWNPLGVEGGCAGGEWSAYLWVDPCVCKED